MPYMYIEVNNNEVSANKILDFYSYQKTNIQLSRKKFNVINNNKETYRNKRFFRYSFE